MRYNLAVVPGDIRGCITKMTGKPLPGSMSEKQVVALVTALRKSEVSKSQCGKRLLKLYDSQAAALRTGARVGW